MIIKFFVQISSLVSCWSPGKHHFPHVWNFICTIESFIIPKDGSVYSLLQNLCWPQAMKSHKYFSYDGENFIENVYLSRLECDYFKCKFWNSADKLYILNINHILLKREYTSHHFCYSSMYMYTYFSCIYVYILQSKFINLGAWITEFTVAVCYY